MQTIGKAKKVNIYLGENDKWGRKPLHMAILELLRKERCAGATVTRGLAGFGAHSQIHTASLVALSSDLPLVVEWIDNPARVERVLPQVREMVEEGLITVQDIDVAFYSHRELRHLSAFVPVQDVMTRTLRTVAPTMPLVRAAELLLHQVEKSLLVVDEQQRLIGIVTDGDLLRKAGLLASSARQLLTTAELELELQQLSQLDQTVQDIMTPSPVTVTPDTTIPDAVALMLAHNIKRVPVVSDDQTPLGVVSRVDVLRAFARPLTVEAPRQQPPAIRHSTVAEVMITDVPTVATHAPLSQVVVLLVSNVRRRVVVVDGEQRVVGIITDGDLIKRATPTERTGIVQSLMNQLPIGQPEAYELDRRTAVEVMTQPVITVTPATPLVEALQQLLNHQIKRLPVVNGENRLVGLVGRSAILQALGQPEG